jgi:hypothetical protein
MIIQQTDTHGRTSEQRRYLDR